MREGTSNWVDLDGPTHYVEYAGPAGAVPLVAVHGLGGSHANWAAVGPLLAEHHRVLVPDLAGHGLTRPDRRGTDVHSNQRLLDRFLREVAGAPVVLMGNSMGGMISILQAARHPETVAGVVLLNPSIPVPLTLRGSDREVLLTFAAYAVPGLGSAVLKRNRRIQTPEQQVQWLFDLLCVDPGRVPPAVLASAVALARERRTYPGIDRAFLDAARSILAMQVRRREYVRYMHGVSVAVLLLHGEHDRLVPVAAARLAAANHPHWQVKIAPDLGHVPQLEAPEWTVESYLEWRRSVPSMPQAEAATD